MTHGISPKTILAFLYPAIATTAGVAIAWLATGTFDLEELRLGLAGYAMSALAALGAWLGQPGNITQRIGTPSDQLLAQQLRSPLNPDELATLAGGA